jgi:hypothetical protein
MKRLKSLRDLDWKDEVEIVVDYKVWHLIRHHWNWNLSQMMRVDELTVMWKSLWSGFERSKRNPRGEWTWGREGGRGRDGGGCDTSNGWHDKDGEENESNDCAVVWKLDFLASIQNSKVKVCLFWRYDKSEERSVEEVTALVVACDDSWIPLLWGHSPLNLLTIRWLKNWEFIACCGKIPFKQSDLVKSYRKMLFDVIRPSVINPLTKRKFIVRNRQSRLNNNEKIMMNYCNNSGLGLEIVRGKKSGK